jgi:glycosyltransferase involved in cell wall biosynthesis
VLPLVKRVLILGVEPDSPLNFRQDLIKELVMQGHLVTVSTMPVKPFQLAALNKLGVVFKAVHFSRAGMNPFRDFATALALYKLFQSVKPEVIIAYTAKPVVYGAIVARLTGVSQFVALITGLGYSFVDGPEFARRVARLIATNLYRVALRFTSVVVFQNPDDRKTFSDLGLLNREATVGVVNGSGVDVSYFNVVPLPTQTTFLMIARLLVDKGIREYAEAALKIREEFPAVRTLLVGSLDPSPNSVTQAELNQWIASGIEYLGQQTDIRLSIAQASVVVLPSYREGTPRAVLEGMAMGRAVITTDAPGCRETVQDGVNGLLVPPRNSSALFAAMKSLVGQSERVAGMGKMSRDIAEKKYEGKAVARDLAKLAGLTK